MKKTRKILATLLFAGIVFMQIMPVAAEELGDQSGSTTGDSTIEAYVDENIYNVVLPTVANVDFTVDPQGLLNIADSSTYGTASGAIYFAHPVDATYADSARTIDNGETITGDALDGDTTYYLLNTETSTYVDHSTVTITGLPADGSGSEYENTSGEYVLYVVDVAAHNTYDDTSEPIEILNKSSLPVDLDFQIVTTNTNIDLVAPGDLAAATEPSLALQVTQTAADTTTATEDITSATYNATTAELTDADAGYSIVSHETTGEFPAGTTPVQGSTTSLYYAYVLADDYTTFDSMEYEISGACNDVDGWGTVLATGTVGLAITWTLSEHETTPPTPSATLSSAGLITITDLSASANLVETGMNGGDGTTYASLTSVSVGNPASAVFDNTGSTWDVSGWSSESGGTVTIQISDAYKTYYTGDDTTFTFTLSDASTVTANATLD